MALESLGPALAKLAKNPATMKALGSLATGLFSAHQANKNAGVAEGYLEEVERLRNNRQDLKPTLKNVNNPFTGMENPYNKLSVATQAAKMQAEQADISLANTLDILRETGKGAGGATALAQAALKSKQNISASIEKQEVNNNKLQAKGQLTIDMAKAQSQQSYDIASANERIELAKTAEKRELVEIARQQALANQAAGGSGMGTALKGVLGGLGGLQGVISKLGVGGDNDEPTLAAGIAQGVENQHGGLNNVSDTVTSGMSLGGDSMISDISNIGSGNNFNFGE